MQKYNEKTNYTTNIVTKQKSEVYRVGQNKLFYCDGYFKG